MDGIESLSTDRATKSGEILMFFFFISKKMQNNDVMPLSLIILISQVNEQHNEYDIALRHHSAQYLASFWRQTNINIPDLQSLWEA